jgi:predicted Zn-ribbon and HTH transcriptional regulator
LEVAFQQQRIQIHVEQGGDRMARVIETNAWRGGNLIVGDKPNMKELCTIIEAWSPELAKLIEECSRTERTCEIVGDAVAGEQVKCSECGFEFDDVIPGTAAWITTHTSHCAGCGARIAGGENNDE